MPEDGEGSPEWSPRSTNVFPTVFATIGQTCVSTQWPTLLSDTGAWAQAMQRMHRNQILRKSLPENDWDSHKHQLSRYTSHAAAASAIRDWAYLHEHTITLAANATAHLAPYGDGLIDQDPRTCTVRDILDSAAYLSIELVDTGKPPTASPHGVPTENAPFWNEAQEDRFQTTRGRREREVAIRTPDDAGKILGFFPVEFFVARLRTTVVRAYPIYPCVARGVARSGRRSARWPCSRRLPHVHVALASTGDPAIIVRPPRDPRRGLLVGGQMVRGRGKRWVYEEHEYFNWEAMRTPQTERYFNSGFGVYDLLVVPPNSTNFGLGSRFFTRWGGLHVRTVLCSYLPHCPCTSWRDGNPAAYMTKRCLSSTALSSRSRPLKECSGCVTTKYCSRSCQRTDWPLHKAVCVPTKREPQLCSENVLSRYSCHSAAASAIRDWLEIHEHTLVVAANATSHMQPYVEGIIESSPGKATVQDMIRCGGYLFFTLADTSNPPTTSPAASFALTFEEVISHGFEADQIPVWPHDQWRSIGRLREAQAAAFQARHPERAGSVIGFFPVEFVVPELGVAVVRMYPIYRLRRAGPGRSDSDRLSTGELAVLNDVSNVFKMILSTAGGPEARAAAHGWSHDARAKLGDEVGVP
ncbi:uncharacterized protein BXZ73DRAFT_81933 [Epithele typhae]|uniref:uncharacterized protein n=1 Tax=Epithele typhae TaxID=378194 RepID=UPI0020081280|nr:uncharacterized protein BXZ73DRAFT_81933 [Epithele typhae]KAH9913472.1 hypothetical protein BXZ73DRAFT_81933 [Epithele typhae]